MNSFFPYSALLSSYIVLFHAIEVLSRDLIWRCLISSLGCYDQVVVTEVWKKMGRVRKLEDHAAVWHCEGVVHVFVLYWVLKYMSVSCVILIRKSLPFYSYVGGNFSIWSSLRRVFERSSFGMCMANHWKILKDFPVSYERDNWTVYPGAHVFYWKKCNAAGFEQGLSIYLFAFCQG